MLDRLGYDATTAASFAPWDVADASLGRVARVDRGVCTVLTEDGAARVSLGGGLLARSAADPEEAPCPGDWAVLRTWPDGPTTLERVLPRRTTLRLRHVDPGEPAWVANVDLVAVVTAGRGADDTTAVRRARETAAASGAEVVTAEAGSAEALDRVTLLVDGRHTLALIGDPAATAVLATGLLGVTTLVGSQPGPGLVVLPGGGVLLDLGDAVGTPTAGIRKAVRPLR